MFRLLGDVKVLRAGAVIDKYSLSLVQYLQNLTLMHLMILMHCIGLDAGSKTKVLDVG